MQAPQSGGGHSAAGAQYGSVSSDDVHDGGHEEEEMVDSASSDDAARPPGAAATLPQHGSQQETPPPPPQGARGSMSSHLSQASKGTSTITVSHRSHGSVATSDASDIAEQMPGGSAAMSSHAADAIQWRGLAPMPPPASAVEGSGSASNATPAASPPGIQKMQRQATPAAGGAWQAADRGLRGSLHSDGIEAGSEDEQIVENCEIENEAAEAEAMRKMNSTASSTPRRPLTARAIARMETSVACMMSGPAEPKNPLGHFLAFLRTVRGSVLRGWRLDLDKDGAGTVLFSDFSLFCRRNNFPGKAMKVWNFLRPDGSGLPLAFHEVAAREALNLERFAEDVFGSFHFALEPTWRFMCKSKKKQYLTYDEFRSAARELGFTGNSRVIFEGLATCRAERVHREELAYIQRVAVRAMRRAQEKLDIDTDSTRHLSLPEWVEEHMGSPSRFLLKMQLCGGTAKISTAECAKRLYDLGFRGGAQDVAHRAAKLEGAGVQVSAQSLYRLVSEPLESGRLESCAGTPRSLAGSRPLSEDALRYRQREVTCRPSRPLTPRGGGGGDSSARQHPGDTSYTSRGQRGQAFSVCNALRMLSRDPPGRLQVKTKKASLEDRLPWDSSLIHESQINRSLPPAARKYFGKMGDRPTLEAQKEKVAARAKARAEAQAREEAEKAKLDGEGEELADDLTVTKKLSKQAEAAKPAKKKANKKAEIVISDEVYYTLQKRVKEAGRDGYDKLLKKVTKKEGLDKDAFKKLLRVQLRVTVDILSDEAVPVAFKTIAENGGDDALITIELLQKFLELDYAPKKAGKTMDLDTCRRVRAWMQAALMEVTIDDLLAKIDPNGDGDISEEEFIVLMRKYMKIPSASFNDENVILFINALADNHGDRCVKTPALRRFIDKGADVCQLDRGLPPLRPKIGKGGSTGPSSDAPAEDAAAGADSGETAPTGADAAADAGAAGTEASEGTAADGGTAGDKPGSEATGSPPAVADTDPASSAVAGEAKVQRASSKDLPEDHLEDPFEAQQSSHGREVMVGVQLHSGGSTGGGGADAAGTPELSAEALSSGAAPEAAGRDEDHAGKGAGGNGAAAGAGMDGALSPKSALAKNGAGEGRGRRSVVSFGDNEVVEVERVDGDPDNVVS
eukprot:TRINITY_DN80484_c0_g1_i1.p1 TRINITY_DN80484_c0_g1~~TRINITY_DN80484_c0_g1_i1.p1  ORF type:complete len:1135 (-),score=353.84 TRINITY_DN80484_c0_g1_i1:212-3616(-)